MSTYKLIEELSLNHELCFRPFVYNDISFLKSNNDFDQKHFYWVEDTHHQVHGHIAFSVVNGVAFSPHKLPFGGLEVSDQLSIKDVTDFMEAIEQNLSQKGIKELRIHQAPNAYYEWTNSTGAFEARGFDIIQNRIFHTIKVDQNDLISQMHKMEQRKIKMCVRDGAEFKELKKSRKVEGFKWIDRFRNLAYKPPSMNWVDLAEASQRNPKVFKVFGVYMDGYLLAATVIVLVNDKAVYHFMPASHVDFQHYKKYSPMVFLVNELYKWCQSAGVEVLDLGTSYVDMKTKDSLVKFKENIGGKATEALSWQKTLSS
mgnify:CR=1 FL=1